jgi:hypothetical protein
MATTKREVTTAEIKKAVSEVKGWEYIADRPISLNEGDWYLRVVLARKTSEYGTEYVVWLYNATSNGLGAGYYSTDQEVAFDKFRHKR